jgi:hypothetical protein
LLRVILDIRRDAYERPIEFKMEQDLPSATSNAIKLHSKLNYGLQASFLVKEHGLFQSGTPRIPNFDVEATYIFPLILTCYKPIEMIYKCDALGVSQPFPKVCSVNDVNKRQLGMQGFTPNPKLKVSMNM